jgi:hypothetical protein
MDSSSVFLKAIAQRRSVIVVLLTLVYSTSFPGHALDVELSERNESALTLRLSNIENPLDKRLAEQYRAMFSLNKLEREPNQFSVTLDSTPGISQYLKAARLSGGIYIHLEQLCPAFNCDGIRFKVRAKRVMLGDIVANESILISGGDAANSAVFLMNEEEPRLRGSIYIGSEFSASAAQQISDSFAEIRQAYRDISGEEPLTGRGILVTMARDKEGGRGFGGDFLNILRLTFHNRRAETEDEIVHLMINTFAHEVAHAFHPARLLEMGSQGRVVSEGSADFLRLIVLRRTGLLDEAKLTAMVSRAFDECLRKRDSLGFLERVEKRTAHFREYYDCGMIYYLALMFESSDGGTVDKEKRFITSLLPAFRTAPEMREDAQYCALISDRCERPVSKKMLGDHETLKAQRLWFDAKWRAHVGRR